MKKTIIFLLAIGFGMVSCTSQEQSETVTPKGYPITFHSGPSNPTITNGEYGIISFFATSGDTSLMPEPMEQEIRIPKEYNKKADLIGGMMMMGEGDSVTIHIPMDSLPAQSKSNPLITDGIYYHIKIKDILDSTTYAAQKEAEMQQMMEQKMKVDTLLSEHLVLYKDGQLSDQLLKLNSGLEILVLEEGTGAEINSGDLITVGYTGVFEKSGEIFDSSFGKGKGFDLAVGTGSVIKGWDEGLQEFNKGGKGILFIPYDLAYGESGRGSIGPKEDLVFYVEIDQ